MLNKVEVAEVRSPRWVVGEKSHEDDPLPSFRSPIPNGEAKFDAERALSLSLRLTHTHTSCVGVLGACCRRPKVRVPRGVPSEKKTKFGPMGCGCGAVKS